MTGSLWSEPRAVWGTEVGKIGSAWGNQGSLMEEGSGLSLREEGGSAFQIKRGPDQRQTGKTEGLGTHSDNGLTWLKR